MTKEGNHMATQNSLFVGTREVADILGISANSVVAAVRRGDIPSVVLGERMHRIPRSYLNKLISIAE